ncbi:MAG: hypothetical protein IJT70_06950 [Clostridia bacterium]|nr:hypothetical protein [Clostridia bacterium]
MLVIGLDVGTTGTKALAVDENGFVHASAYRGYELKHSGVPGSVSQNADDWWNAVVCTVKNVAEKVAPRKIEAIGLSTQGATMLAADAEGNALCDAITWMDSRAEAECAYLDGAIGTETVYEKCGWPLTSAGDAAKILWLKNNMPEVFKGAACFPSTIEFINKKLTGRFVTDPTNAAIRQLFNIKDAKWDEEILSAIGITDSRLPEVVSTGAEVGTLTDTAAKALGLDSSVKVFCGAHDQYCASLGSGAVEAGDMMLATGTAWVILGITDKLLYTKNHICPGIHPAEDRYGAMASLVSAGSAMNWFRNALDENESYKEIDSKIDPIIKRAKDVLALPYVAGAGFPHSRPDASCSIHGIRSHTDKYDVACAIMEGVAFEARTVIEGFAENGIKIDRLLMTGGAARSDLWSRIVRDVTGCRVKRPKEPETCCIGAASIALVSLGVYKDYAECSGAIASSVPIGDPDDDFVSYYNGKYERYCDLRKKIFEA